MQVRGFRGGWLERVWGSHLGVHLGHKVLAIAGGVNFQALQRQRLQSLGAGGTTGPVGRTPARYQDSTVGGTVARADPKLVLPRLAV